MSKQTYSLTQEQLNVIKAKNKRRHIGQIRVFCNNKLAILGLVLFLIIVLLAAFADVIADYKTEVIMINIPERMQTPNAEHILGTDELGRDLFARVVHGARISLKIGFLSVFISTVFGIILGASAGYFGGFLDNVIMRFMDILACLPAMLLAVAIVAAFGASQLTLILALAVSYIPGMARVVRSSVLSVRDTEYVEAAKAIGVKTPWILSRHVLVNCMAPIIVHVTIIIAGAIFMISCLSFIGLGIAPPEPEWGSMLSTARTYMRDYPHMVVVPGMAIFLTVFSLNLLGDGLRDALDPKLRR